MTVKPVSDSSASAELNPCPFCGSDVLAVARWWDGGNYFVVHCQRCKAEGPPAFPMEAAREMWNGRAAGEAD
jgi:Lar family restriction alleviation protein